MSRVVVTGGAGKAGRAVVRDLLEHGYDVVSIDLVRDPSLTDEQQMVVDLTDYGETVDAPAGTLVYVPPNVQRKATGDGTVLALGGTPGEAY